MSGVQQLQEKSLLLQPGKIGNIEDRPVKGQMQETWQPRRRVWPQHTAAILEVTHFDGRKV
uniref:Uncharacterized protein n=1 Tax=Timema poppense TaxID=170557 RepID=A0A7R9HDY2_TIMPO|nr:unnamed protein product [Timema poppensis]